MLNKNIIKKNKSPQEFQDDVFRKMKDEKKIELWSNFWLLARELSGNRIYGTNRPKKIIGKYR